MKDLKVKATETRDMLRSIDAVLRDVNEDVIQKALRESIFPLVEDGNGPGFFWGDESDYNDACEVNDEGIAGDCRDGKCIDRAMNKSITNLEIHRDAFAVAVWEVNTFFCVGRNDAIEDQEAADHGLDYKITNLTTPIWDEDGDEWGDRDPPE